MAKPRFHDGFGRLSAVALMLLLTDGATAFAQSNNEKPAKGAPVAAAPAAAPAGDTGLKARVETLEEQLVDMQVVVGTLESLAKNAGSAPAAFPAASSAPASSGGDAARIDSLETQVQALTAQIQQLSDQVRSLGGTPRRSDIPSNTNTALSETGSDPGADPGPVPAPSQSSSQGPSPGFGSTTVSSGGGDAIGGLLNNDTKPQPGAKAGSPSGTSGEVPAGGMQAVTPAPVSTAALPPAVEGPTDPKQLYETAYGYLLQRDYGAAEAAFDDFLKRFPNDSLSGNAQYWLGETHFVRGQYKAAAGAFLKGYQTYAQSAKAPDSLLKLAMSLDRLGQKDAACSSYAEFSTKFPNAPQSIKSRAQTERQRVGCQ